MKKIITFVAVAVVLMVSSKAFSQQTESWNGIEWECATTDGMKITEDGAGTKSLSLELPAGSSTPVMAYHCTAGFTNFISASTPWIEVSFEDLYPDESSAQLWIRDACPPAATYFITQIGTNGLDDTYFILWGNPNTGQFVKKSTDRKRSGGVHTIRILKQENGAVEYYLDDQWLWSTEDIPAEYTYQAPEYFGNIILMAQYSSATFTDYQFGDGYSPEASSPLPIEVEIDIKPFSHKNKIYRWKGGIIPVAILSKEDFDAPSEVDRNSVTFGATGEEHSKAFFLRRGKDVNHDGMKDLIFFFNANRAGFKVGDEIGYLMGSTLKGNPIKGQDKVQIVKRNRWHLWWGSHKEVEKDPGM